MDSRLKMFKWSVWLQKVQNYVALIYFFPQVKFHIISQHKLRRCSGSNISSLSYLNMEQLTKALATLFNLYEANRTTAPIFKNEADFFSFYVLLHLDSKTQGTVAFFYIIVVFIKDCELQLNIRCLLSDHFVCTISLNIVLLDLQGETLSLWFRRVPSHIMKSTEMNFARKILR